MQNRYYVQKIQINPKKQTVRNSRVGLNQHLWRTLKSPKTSSLTEEWFIEVLYVLDEASSKRNKPLNGVQPVETIIKSLQSFQEISHEEKGVLPSQTATSYIGVKNSFQIKINPDIEVPTANWTLSHIK